MSKFDKLWVPHNRLIEARNRNRLIGDTALALVYNNSKVIEPLSQPLNTPMNRNLVPPLFRKMGTTTIDHRRYNRISPNLWDNTPVKLALDHKVIGDIDITNELEGFDSIGWEWNRRENKLYAYLSSHGKKFIVKIPANKVRQIFNNCLKAQESSQVIKSTTIDGVFKDVSRGLKKASRKVSPARFKNPRQFVNDASRDIKKLVKGAGRQMINVASSPIFGGIMAGMAAVPPLTAVGAAGLAAFAAANAIKPAYDALEATIDTVDSVKKKKKASEIVNNFSSGTNNMSIDGRKLLTSALKSTSADKTPKKTRRFRKERAVFRLKQNRLSPVL